MRGILEPFVRFFRNGADADLTEGVGATEERRRGVSALLEERFSPNPKGSIVLPRPRDAARVFSAKEACTEKGKHRREVSSGLRQSSSSVPPRDVPFVE